MREMEQGFVYFLNEFLRRNRYHPLDHQMLHGVTYRRKLKEREVKRLRMRHRGNCLEAAYELKTYYMEHGIRSNTVVLKMRPPSPEIQEFSCIRIPSVPEGMDHTYSHHAIEIFVEDGSYQVFDVLHRDQAMPLETYLDDVCRTNHCPRSQLRYDMGYLAPCHALAGNMQELSDVMRYLDRTYGIGKPRLNLMNTQGEEGMFLSDDMMLDFDAFGSAFGCSGETAMEACRRVYEGMMSVQFQMLHMLCLGHIMRDPLLCAAMAESLFDDDRMCQMVEELLHL